MTTHYTNSKPVSSYGPSASTVSAHSSMISSQARIAYFITRNNGLPIPLIPADQLPYSVKLQNVPRVLSPEQTYGLTYVGSAPFTGVTFVLERDASPPTNSQRPNHTGNDGKHMTPRTGPSTTSHFLAPDALARQAHAQNGNPTIRAPGALSVRPSSAAAGVAPSWRRPVHSQAPAGPISNAQSAIEAILNSSAGAETAERVGYRAKSSVPFPSGIVPDQEKKEYCTHWILQGWCAFEQQGCRYKHEMLDKEGLTKIGIKNVPRWWLERNSPFKLGGDRPMLIGPARKTEEWLKVRKGSDRSSEYSDATEIEDSPKGNDVSSGGEKKKPAADLEKSKVKTKDTSIQGAEKSKRSIQSLAIPPTSPTQSERSRKPSAESDLIELSTSAPRKRSPTTTNQQDIERGSKHTRRDEATTKPDTKQKDEKPVMASSKVFVPAGEDPEKHIDEVKKRERAAHNKVSRKTTKDAGKNATDLIQKQQQDTKPTGSIYASRWATNMTPADEGEAEKKQVTPVQQILKPNCRPRRPASSSPSTAARAKLAEKK